MCVFFKGGFGKVRRLTIDFFMSMCLSASVWNISEPTGCLNICFWKSFEKFQVSLKSDESNGLFLWRPVCICGNISPISPYNCFRQTLLRKWKHIFSITFFFLNRAVYEIMWKNTVERGKSQMTIRRMRFACWITKATDLLTYLLTYSLTHSLHGAESFLRS